MDKRHWWFASKLQETFHFGGFDNPTLLEDFLSDPDVTELINSFLAPGEPRKLFFYCDEPPPPKDGSSFNYGTWAPTVSPRRLHATSELTSEAVNRGKVCLYVLRADPSNEVEPSQMERELFCGEIRHSALSSLAALLCEAYNPLLHSQKDWGECSEAAVASFLETFDRHSSALLETASLSQARRQLLPRPSAELQAMQQHRRTNVLSTDTVAECEELVGECINYIEGLLLETTDERMENPHSSPLSEVSKWRQRHCLLTAVVEQLKTREMRGVFTLLVAAKSRVLKKWKTTDSQLTDAFNTARDRVRYLESLSPHLEALEASPSLPSILSSLLPALVAGVKKMEGISRALARSGYLGILFTKISNAIVRICTASIKTYCTRQDEKDEFWDILSPVIEAEAKSSSSHKEHPFLTHLSLCLQVASHFTESLHHVRDVLMAQPHFSFSHTPTVAQSTVSLSGGHKTLSTSTGGDKTNQPAVPGSLKLTLTSVPPGGAASPGVVTGVALTHVDQITTCLRELNCRVSQVMEIVSTLAQFQSIVASLRGLPRVSGLWESDPPFVKTSLEGDNDRDIPVPEGSVNASDYLEQVFARNEYPLPPLKSEETAEKPEIAKEESSPVPHLQPETETTPPQITIPPPPPSPGGDSIAEHVWCRCTAIFTALVSACPRGSSDVFSVRGRSLTVFPTAYTSFTSQVSSLDTDISNYLTDAVPKMPSSLSALDVNERFSGLREREVIGKALQSATSEAFTKYAAELEEIKTNYDKQKSQPPVSPSLPPIAGTLSWVREMLVRVTKPMDTFKTNSCIMQSVASLEVCKLHNQLSTALLMQDTFLISRWHMAVEAATTALGLPLLVQDPTCCREGETSPRVRVNFTQSLLDVIAESKALGAAGVQIPEVAKIILSQERRVKRFRQSLEQVVGDLYSTLDSLDIPLRTLLLPHIDYLHRCLLPGCSTITWSTLNIDAYLHQATSAVASFQTTVSRIRSILDDHVYSVLRDIAKSSLYDVELATSRKWAPRDFSDAMKSSVVRRMSEVRGAVAGVQRAVLACIEIARGGEREGEEGFAGLRSNLVLAGVERDPGKTDRQKTGPNVSKQSSQSTRANTTTASSQGGWREREQGWRVTGDVGEGGEATLSYVCGLIFNAVTEMVARSLYQLSTGLRRKRDEGDGGEEESSKNRVIGQLSRSFVDLSGQRTVRFQDSQTVDNPRAVLAEFSHRSRSKFSETIPQLQLEARVLLSVPRLLMEPRLPDIHSLFYQLTSLLLSLLNELCWWAGPGAGREFLVMWDASGAVALIHSEIFERFRDLEPVVDLAISSLRLHDFLWREDMHAAYQSFLQSQPSQAACCQHIERLSDVEKELGKIPALFSLGPLHLSSLPVTHSLSALALAWKLEYASFLHDQAQSSLRSLVESRLRMTQTLRLPVETLVQLRDTLQLLLDIQDLQSSIHDQYTPVENSYCLLRQYTQSLPRSEVVEVESLRRDWEDLVTLADTTRRLLLHDQRHIHERETENQVRGLQVEMIKFRNSFDTEGPLVPGLSPHAAIQRLESFSRQCKELESHRELLTSVETLLSLPVSSYPELDQTRGDLFHLHSLYSSYSQFLQFDQQFRDTLWLDVQLPEAEETLERLWEETACLPPAQQEWSPTIQLRADICQYRDLLPLLAQLHSREVRNRHWLQVMRVTNCTFQLEGSVFRLSHILDASLPMYEEAVEKIVQCAQKELKLENEFHAIEESWNEQVLQFASYKELGEMLLDLEHTHSLCEGLEGAGLRLAGMLVSDHVTHMRDDVMQWAGRLSRVHDLLTQWLTVQELWRQLESVFSSSSSSLSFLDETTRFEAVTSSWAELMSSARASPGVVECCESGEEGRGATLLRLSQELELCKNSLSPYLLSKRQAFPRFFFLTDDALLDILSSPLSPSSLAPHLPSLFTNTRSLLTPPPPSPPSTANEGESPLIITAVESEELELLDLNQPVTVCGEVEVWLSLLLSSLRSSLSSLLASSLGTEDLLQPHLPCQIASLNLFLKWTSDTELALSQCRYDKRALPGLRSKFTTSVVGKLTHMLMRSRRKAGDHTSSPHQHHLILPCQQLRLQAMTALAVWLRDVTDNLCHQTIRGAADFEWQRYPRLYVSPDSAHPDTPPSPHPEIELRCLHMRMGYGFEYTGCRALPAFTSRMNNYTISLMQGMESGLHSMVSGPRDSGKEETVHGVAQLMGRFLFVYHCTAHSDTRTLARVMEGLAQSGGWGCLTDIHSLPRSTLSVVCHMVEAVSSALRDKLTSFKTPSGRETQLKPGMLVVFTSTGHTPWPLPPSLAPIFRTFRLPSRDPALFLLAWCTALGLRSPRQLSCKLASLHHMANSQLDTRLPLHAISQVLTELVSSQRTWLAAGHTHLIKSDAGVAGGGGKGVEEHCSHRQMTSRSSPVKEAHTGQKTISLVTTPPFTQPLPPSAAREHTAVAQLTYSLLAPRFPSQERVVFLEMVKSAFALDSSVVLTPHQLVGVASQTQTPPTSSATGNDPGIDKVLATVAKKAGLVATDTWSAKVKEILLIVQLTNRHLMLTGEAASGKTAALHTAAATLNALPNQRSKVEIHRVFPGAFDDISTLIGRFSPGGVWEDGVCISLVRRGLKASSSLMWVCLDGAPSESCLHPLTELLSGSNTLTLPSGERVVGGAESGLRLVLETGNLNTATPASLHTCGVVFFSCDVLSWKPLIEVWLRSRHGKERACLRKQLPLFVGPVAVMVCGGDRGKCCWHSEVGLTQTCLAYLSSLLNIYSETAESFSQIHVLRLLVFSIIWSFGAVLEPGVEREEFGRLLKSLTNSLPDDDTVYSVFDYYVDESGEWDLWQTRLPSPLARETTPPPVDLLGSVHVDTTDTVRVELLLDLSLSAGRNVILTGPHGSGKTSVCKHFLQARALSHVTSEGVCHLSLDGHASSSCLHHFMEVHMHHSQGSTYRPQDQKTLHLFIDDLHLPLQTTPTLQEATPPSTHEYLRQLMDNGGVYSLGKPNTLSTIENLSVFTGFTTTSSPSLPSPRLLRHFSIITLPELTGAPLTTILTDSLRSHCAGKAGLEAESTERAGLEAESGGLSSVVEKTTAVFLEVRESLRLSQLPGRRHYFFSLSHIESAFQGLYHCLSSSSCPSVGLSWYLEMTRSLTGPLCHSTDRDWLTSLIHSHAETLPGGLPKPLPVCLSAIPLEIKQGEVQPPLETTPINQLVELELHPMIDCDNIEGTLHQCLMRCQQNWGDFPLTLSCNNTACIVKLHRALKQPRGNCILCGPQGQQLHSLATFSLYLAGYQLHTLDSSSLPAFRSSLRALFRRTGLERKPVSAILTEEDMEKVGVLQELNSLFATGELPSLFSNDEMNGILHALGPSIKRDFPSEDTHPMQYFTARIARYFRLVMCLSPSSTLLTSMSQLFPGLMGKCQIVWTPGWTNVELSNSLYRFFFTSSLAVSLKENIREPLYDCMRGIHQLVLKQSGHLQLAGHLPSTDPTTGQSSADPSSLTSFHLLMERVVGIERELGGHNSNTGFAGEFSTPYIGPLTFRSLLENFCGIYSVKKSSLEAEVEQLKRALQSLERTEKEVGRMRESLANLQKEHTTVCQQCSQLLEKLTRKSCQVERVKALLSGSGSVMNAIQLTAEEEKAMAEDCEDEDEFLASLLGSCLRKKGSRLELQLAMARERERDAEGEEEEARKAMVAARDEVQDYEEKIDRNTVDQIKSLPSPPAVVCTVMQVMLTLLSQHRGRGRGGGGGGGRGEVSEAPEEDSLASSSASDNLKQPRARKTSISPHVSKISAPLSPSSDLREVRERWTAIKLAIGDSHNFLDLVSGINWRGGLTIEAMNLIKAHLCTGEGGEGGGVRKEIGRTGLQTRGLVTFSAARHADEVLGIIFQFAVGMLRYTGLLQSHLLAQEKLNRARQRRSDLDQQLSGGEATCPTRGDRQTTGVELRERDEETELNEASLRRLEEELRGHQEEFNEAAVKKHSLGQTCSQLAESLKSASHLLDSLKYRQEAWQYRLDHTPSEHLLATNCLLAAAITTYIGPYPILSRFKMVSALTGVCLDTKMVAEEEANQLLKIEEYPLFMIGQPGLYQLELEGLPPDLTSRVSACVISRGHAHSPPLISDPFNMAAPWISRHYQGSKLVDFKSPSLRSSLTEAMEAGSSLTVTGVEGQRLPSHALLSYLLKYPQDTGSHPSMIKIDKEEVEIHPDFKLVLVTTSLPRELPSELVATTTVVLFWPEVGGVRDLLLDRLLWQQNSKTAQEREHLRHEVHNQSWKVEETERQLLALLSSELCVHSDHQTARDLLLLNTSHNNAQDSLAAALDSLDQMARVQLSSLSSLASRAALVSSVVMATGISLPLYAVSYDYVESVFLSFLEQMGSHLQGAESVVKMTQFAYQHFSRGMVERDRLLLAFSLVLQLELSGGVVTHREISYLLRPSPGMEYAVKGLATQTGMDLTDSTPVSLGRRPYDWILEAQWQSLLMLTSHFQWAQRALRLAVSDDAQGLQANMRHIFQSKHPELYITMGDKKLDEKALKDGRNLIQILLLNSGIRPDRLALSIQAVSEAVLMPPRSSYDMPVELRKFHKTCSKGKIPLVIFHDDPHLPTNQIRALARKLHVPLRVVCVHGTGETELETVREALAVSSSHGEWLLLHNIQESENVVSELTSLLRTYPPSDGWRVWLSVHAGSVTSLPVSLLHSVCRVVLDTPSSLKGSLLHTLASLPPDLLSASTRVEWLPLLHSSALLFPLLRARREMHTLSWRYCPPLPHTLLADFLRYLKTVVEIQNETTSTGGYAPLSWSGLRHMLSEVFFGSLVCDPVDFRTLTSLVEAWIHPGGPRREPELYHIPKLFFTPGTRPSLLCQEVESATPPLLVTPDLCGLNPSPEIKIGHLEALLPSLASLLSLLHLHSPLQSSDHTHQTRPLPHSRLENYATRHLLTPPTAVPEKLPSWVPIPSHVVEWSMGDSHIPIPTDVGTSMWNISLSLEATIKKIQGILPSGWTKESVSEKLSHHQNSSLAFQHFMTSETSHMTFALSAIHSSLSSLSLVLQISSRGDPHSLSSIPHLSLLVLSLLSHRVPSFWVQSVGTSAAPQNWPLGEWVRDLALRRAFLDQVLTVGVAKVPAYWLGAFFNPRAFLSVVTQHVLQSQCGGCGASEDTFFLAEVTPRNKDHVRDPPPEGEVFVYGCYMWGCRVERSANVEFQDLPPKHHSPTALPLLHLALTTPTNSTATSEAASGGGVAKGAESKTNTMYHCPVFENHRERKECEEIFRLIVQNSEVPSSRWAMRSISCTLRPF